ncbi:MAG: methylenetetrahydrofolate reductase, partial [Clostridia bacterium]
MYVSDLFRRGRTVFSVEVFPPKRNGSIQTIYRTIENLQELAPDFISVTYGAGGNLADDTTCRIASAIKHRYGIEPLAHLTCVNSTCTEIETVLTRLRDAGIENVLALRGDRIPDRSTANDYQYAYQLVEKIRAFGGFHISAACYPEGHCECASLAQDIVHLRRKVDAGAQHLISQL